MKICWGITAWATGAFLLLASCELGSETENERTGGQIFNPDGKPAKGANVQFYAVDYLPGEMGESGLEFETLTDKEGRYDIPKLEKGRYNIISSLNGKSAKLDSIYIDKSVNSTPSDTLGDPGTYIGYVKLQPNHDPRTVVVQILGTQFFANVDKEGEFKFENIPAGDYKVRLSTEMDEYTITFQHFSIQEGEEIKNPEPWELIYTGIPIVTNISAAYDTIKGIVTLNWDKSEFSGLGEYVIFKDTEDEVVRSTSPFAKTNELFFMDTLFEVNSNLSQIDTLDKQDLQLIYRVAIRDKSEKIGGTFNQVEVQAINPTRYYPTIKVTYFQINNGDTLNVGSIGDTFTFHLELVPRLQPISKVSWFDNSFNVEIKSTDYSNRKTEINEWIDYSFSIIGENFIGLVLEGNLGNKWEYSVSVKILEDSPIVQASSDSKIYSINDTIHLSSSYTERFGKIVKWEWDVGNTGNFVDGPSSGVFVGTAPENSDSVFKVVVKVTDDDGNIASDTLALVIIQGSPQVSINDSIIYLNETTTLYPHIVDPYGEIISVEWDIGLTGNFVKTDSFWSPEILISNLNPNFHCAIRVIDDDNNIVKDTVHLQTHIKWLSLGSSNSPKSIWDAFVFKDSLMVYQSAKGGTRLWASSQGKNWRLVASSPPWGGKYVTKPVIHNDSMFVLSWTDDLLLVNQAWKSGNGIDWTSNHLSLEWNYDEGLFFVSYEGILFAGNGGSIYQPNTGVFYESEYGEVWNLVEENGVPGWLPPDHGAGHYKTTVDTANNRIYFAVVNGSGVGYDLQIWSFSSWGDMELTFSIPSIKDSGHTSSVPIKYYQGYLCAFIHSKSVFDNAGKMVFYDEKSGWVTGSNLPVTSSGNFSTVIELNGSLFLFDQDSIYVSK